MKQVLREEGVHRVGGGGEQAATESCLCRALGCVL